MSDPRAVKLLQTYAAVMFNGNSKQQQQFEYILKSDCTGFIGLLISVGSLKSKSQQQKGQQQIVKHKNKLFLNLFLHFVIYFCFSQIV